MAKRTGLGANLYAGGYNISGDTAAVDELGGGPEPLELTGIDKSAYERYGGLRTGTGSWTVFFNPGAGATVATHDLLAALPTTDVHLMYCTGTTVGDAAACMVAKQVGYAGTREDDGALTFEVEAQSNAYGLEWGHLLTAGIKTDTSATDGATLDFGATIGSTAFGLQAYLQVFSVTGVSVAVKLADSADGASWADISGAAFTAVTSGTGHAAQRIAVTGTVRRYVRCYSENTFSNAQFAVTVVKNQTAVTF